MQFRDLSAQYRALKPEIDAGIRSVIDSSAFILGKPVAELEDKLSAYVGRKHCVSCANGTDALQLSLMAMGVGPGDAVFTADFTYFASAGCASILGATPVLVDIDLNTFNISPEALEKTIQQTITEDKLKPKVIIPVDLFGQPADYDRILPIAEKYGLKVLEDAAQGFGGNIRGKRACSFGDISATSFFPAKPLGCYGDGGAIFTDDDEVDARLRSLRAQGKSPTDKYDNREIGMNSRLDTLQAAILLPKLRAFADYELEAVNQVAGWYTARLKDRFVTPAVPESFYSSWAQYTILLEDESDRNTMQKRLKEKGVPSMIYYPRGLHQQEAFRRMDLPDALYPNTIAATKRVLSLPMHPYLKEEDVDDICAAVLGTGNRSIFRKQMTGDRSMDFNDIYRGLISGREKIAVVGLGYVGMPLAVEFAKHVPVIGFDINEKRVNEYRNGIDATNEVGEAIKNTTVDFTADAGKLKEARFLIVAVPTPVNEDTTPDLRPIEGASKTVGQNLAPGSIVVFESTVYPGVTEDICIPIIEQESGMKCGVEWKIGYSPERINPGDRVHTLTNIRKIVSGMDPESAAEIQKVYDIIIEAGTFQVSDIKTAEAVKVVENSQRDINIAFMNEIAMICDRMHIDTDEVLAGMNTKWNALGFRPGLVGGHCIGIDPYYLTNAAEKLGYHSQIILNGRKVNDSMGAFVADAAIKQMIEAGLAPKKATVLILGITFKENCPDTRNSKVVDIINRLKEYEIDPVVTDRWADADVARHEYGVELVDWKDIPKADCVIVAVGHSEFRALSMMQLKELFKAELADEEKVLIDVKSLYRMDELKASGMRFWRL